MSVAMHQPGFGYRERVLAYREQTLRLFANVLFAVSLFCVWGLLTLIGVIVDQNKDADVYFRSYPAPIARAILRLGFNDIYHGPAYLGIIGLILCSLAVCTFRRVIPARLPALRAVAIEHMALNARIRTRMSVAAAQDAVERALRGRGWSIRKREIAATEWTFADRHNWARRGVLVAHVGFVIIAAGACIYWARGFSGEMTDLVGSVTTIPQTGAMLQLHDFAYRIDPIMTKAGLIYQPIDYVSKLTVTNHAGQTRDEILRVNHPVDIDGVSVYQSAYGTASSLVLKHNGKAVDLSPVRPFYLEGDVVHIGGTERYIRYEKFVGTIAANGTPAADPRPNRPGVVLSFFEGDTMAGALLVPINATVDLGDGYSLSPTGTKLYSGFQYRYDPGIPLVGIGAFVLLAGLCISFYLLPARLSIMIEGNDQAASIGLCATTVKGYEIFEEPFADITAALEAAVNPPRANVGHAPLVAN